MAHPAESAFVGAIIGLVTALVAFPTRVGRLLAPAGGVVVDGLRWASETFPYWAFILTVFLGTMVVAVVVAYEFARVGYAAVRRAGPRTKRIVGFVTPNTPIGKAAFAFCFTILFLVGSVWALPYVIGDMGANSPISDSSDLSNASNPQDVLDRTNDRLDDVLDGDVATHGEGIDGARTAEREYDRPRPDRDGDRLKDSWERAGETPAGVELPDADPDRMDIYLQIDYAAYTRPLDESEKRQLKRVWAEMPVENPDGSTGITLHIDDGPLGAEAVYDGHGEDETTRFYTERYVGDRRCRYHQIVVGQVEDPTIGGRASAPGFSGYVQSDQNEAYQQARDGDDPRQVSSRVHVITHELLHNVVGEVDGSLHTNDGWLAPSATPDDAFLSDAAASELNNGLAGSAYYQEKLC